MREQFSTKRSTIE